MELKEGDKMYGSWNDGSSVFKDRKGYYIVAVNPKSKPDESPLYKKYLKKWKPSKNDITECFVKKRWTQCNKNKNKNKKNKTRKH
jgi:hypothetical protein